MAGDMCGRRVECMAGETATAAGGTHPTGMHSCSRPMGNSGSTTVPSATSAELVDGEPKEVITIAIYLRKSSSASPSASTINLW